MNVYYTTCLAPNYKTICKMCEGSAVISIILNDTDHEIVISDLTKSGLKAYDDGKSAYSRFMVGIKMFSRLCHFTLVR